MEDGGERRPLTSSDVFMMVAEPELPEFLTGYEFLKFFIEANIDRVPDPLPIEDYLDQVSLDRADALRLIQDYSTGMKNKLQMLMFLILRPKIILMDEPLTSLDVVVQLEMKKIIRSIKEDHIIIFSTHILQLAQDLCDRIILLHGKNLHDVEEKWLRRKALRTRSSPFSKKRRVRRMAMMENNRVQPAPFYGPARNSYKIHKKISTHENVNLILHLLRKLPFIGPRLGSSYKLYGLKKAFIVLNPLFSGFKFMIGTLIALFIVSMLVSQFGDPLFRLLGETGLPMALTGERIPTSNKAGLVLFAYGVIAILDSVLVNNFRVFPNYLDIYRDRMEVLYPEYTRIRPLMNLVYRTLFFTLVGGFLPEFSLIEGFLVGLSLSLAQLALEELMVAFFEKKGKSFMSFKRFWAVYLLFLLLALLATARFAINWMALLPWTLILSLPACLLSFPRAFRHRSHADLVETIRQASFELDKQVEEITEQKVRVSLGAKEGESALPVGSGVTGYAYINRIFFHRFRKKLLRPVLIKSGVLGLVGSFLVFQMDPGVLGDFVEIIPFFLPFVAYMIFNQARLTDLIYKEWDRPLNNYGFYKEGVVLLRVFFYRLRSTALMNVLPVLVMAVLEVAIFLKVGPGFPLAPVLLITLLWGAFFTIYPYFTYYFFQPHRKGSRLSFLNPIFSLLLYILVFFVFPNLPQVISARTFGLVSIAILTAFLLLASFSIYFLAPKLLKD